MKKYQLPKWTWDDVVGWTNRMASKHGGTVYDKNGQTWDWGQAICRDAYGSDWMNSDKFKIANDAEVPPAEMIYTCVSWEAGSVPHWVRLF